ncbi:MAG: UDP-N-acetyl glucosamine 2-epimerase, partial [Thaumarchaeota archaeon]
RSALGAALCANRLGIRVAHVEAGARSMEYDMEEEINRRIIDHCSNLLFAPTLNCYKNLKKESVLGHAYFTGDTMYDVFLEFKKILNLKKSGNDKYVLMTLHRQDNIRNPQRIKKIIDLAKQISAKGWDIVFPVHPHTQKQIKSFGISLGGINTTNPVKYSEMLRLLCNANLLLTDSGGLQKEAFWLNTPCITLRKSSEWIETLDGTHNTLLSTIKKSSLKQITNILKQKQQKIKSINQFGDGTASKKITSILLH